MKINEIFSSIQGEGIMQGFPTIFIRTSGCNLRCLYCDTQYAYDEGVDMDLRKILEEIKNKKIRRICLTGGEPLLQKDCAEFIKTLVTLGYQVVLETNGSISLIKVPRSQRLSISMDVKCPSSLEHSKMKLENLTRLGSNDVVKFIIGDLVDMKFAKNIIKRFSLEKKTNVIMQPVWKSDPKKIVSFIMDNKLDVRVGLQIHKFIWPPETRGV